MRNGKKSMRWKDVSWLALFAVGIVLLVLGARFLDSVGLGGVASLVGIGIAVAGSILFGSRPGVVRRLPPWAVEVLAALVPFVADQQKTVKECAETYRNMEAAALFYDLGPIPEKLRSSVVATLASPRYDRCSSRLRHCARLFSTELAPEHRVSEDLLLLLYYERNPPMPATLWPAEERTLGELADILADHPLVRRATAPELILQPAVLRAVLRGLMKLSFEDLLTVVRALHDLWRVADGYWSFVLRNFSSVRGCLLPAGVFRRVETAAQGFPAGARDVDDLQATMPGLLADLGVEVVRAWLAASPDAPDRLDDGEVRAVALLSVAAFVSRSGDLMARNHLATVCHGLANLGSDAGPPWHGEGVGMVWAYLVAKQEHRNGLWDDGQQRLRMDGFLCRRREVLARRPEEERELQTLYFVLKQGEWTIRREELVDWVDRSPTSPPEAAAVGPPSPASPADILDIIECIPTSEAPLKQLFLRLNLETIERLTEAKRIRPYLLTVGRSDEPVTALLDCLTAEGKVRALAAAGISFWTEGGEQKYNFVQYTPYSRIGIVPPELAFIDFCKQLRRDLEGALKNQALLLPPSRLKGRERPNGGAPEGEGAQEGVRPYEVLAHIFRPAVGNPFEFERGERRGMLGLKGILAQHVDRPTLARLPEHFGQFEPALRVPMVENLLRRPISRACGPEIKVDATVARRIDQFDESIKERFLGALGVDPYDDEGLLEAIRSGSDQRADAHGLLARAIRDHVPPNDLGRDKLDRVAEAYLRELEGLTLALEDLEVAIGRGSLLTGGRP